MNESSMLDYVRSSPFGDELTGEESKALAQVVATRELGDGDILISEGHVDNSVHVVISGRLEVIKDAGGGEEDVLHTLKEGDIAGAMGFVDGTEHSASLRAVGDTLVFSLERERLETLLNRYPTLVYRVMRVIIRSVHSIVRRMNNQHVQMTNYITKQHGKY